MFTVQISNSLYQISDFVFPTSYIILLTSFAFIPKSHIMLQYLLKLTISLSIVYLFYQLFLRRLTFYGCNRWYLLLYSMACFVIPFVNVFTIIVNRPALRESAIINYIPAITPTATTVTTSSAGIDWLLISALVFITGMVLMIVRLLLQYYSLYKMRAKAVLLYEDKVKLYHIDGPVIPFSFGSRIYVNQHQHSESELKEIIRHEFIHVKQRHSLDIIWSELLCILNWYNPFAWLLRHDIRQNLEFIADQQVLQTGLDRKQYQYLLLKVIGVNSYSIATNFNFSSLKRRIAMMNKTKSARVHLIRFLFLLPVLVVLLLAFRNATQTRHQPVRGTVTDTLPKATNEIRARWNDIRYFEINRYDSLNGYNARVMLKLKDGKTENYDFAIPEQKTAFEEKYGVLPKMKTPPEPLIPQEPLRVIPDVPDARELPEAPEAPEPPAIADIRETQEAPEAPEIAEVPEAPVPPPPPTPIPVDCINKKGYCITIANNYGEQIVIVKDKNKKILEAITLTDWNRDKQYEEKYGEIPPQKVRLVLSTKTVTKVNVKPVTLIDLKPVPAVNAKPVLRLDVKPAPAGNPKQVELIDLKPVPAVNAKPAIRTDTKPAPAGNAKPIVLTNLKVFFSSVDQKPVITREQRVTQAEAKPVDIQTTNLDIAAKNISRGVGW